MSKVDQIKVGDKYGHWTVLGERNKNRVLCQCDCENKTIREVDIYRLLDGRSTSCGCAKVKNKVNIGDKFNHWTVIGARKGKKVLCQCDCESKTIREVSVFALVHGKTISCGCTNRKYLIHVGDKFGKLTVLEVNARQNKDGKFLHKCQCDCKNKTICYVRACNLVLGKAKSCGCGNPTVSNAHHESHTRFYYVWSAMKKRCLRFDKSTYKNYGGRGIKVCDKWLDYLGFREDMFESYQQHIEEYGEKDTTLDRIDVNGDYCPENCRWATIKEQRNNTRKNIYLTNSSGVTHTIAEWAEIKNIGKGTLWNRVKNTDWSVEKILNTPVRSLKKE